MKIIGIIGIFATGFGAGVYFACVGLTIYEESKKMIDDNERRLK